MRPINMRPFVCIRGQYNSERKPVNSSVILVLLCYAEAAKV